MNAPAYQIDGKSCSAKAFYALACDPSRSVSVEACAGAGKTWMLVSRIVRALLDGAAPGEVLAITFTRKAAGEMRRRLHDWLREWAACDKAARIAALTSRGLAEAEARAAAPRLAGLHAQLLRSSDAVQISTFHAWFARLLRWAPSETLDALGLHAGMDLLEEVDDLLPALMQRFQRDVQRDPQALADYQRLTQRHRRSRLADWLVTALGKRIEIELADALGRLEPSVVPADAIWPDCAGLEHPVHRLQSDVSLRDGLAGAARALGTQNGVLPSRAAEAIVQALAETDPAASHELLRQALFTQKGEPKKLADHVPQAQEAIHALQRLGLQAAQQDAHLDHLRMCRLTRLLLAQWKDLKRERSLVDMADLERCAFAVLSDSVASGWVQERLDQRIRHLLIDEFQDTSPLQWHALQSWLGSYAGAGGGASGQRPLSVFIVGDPKQSIYRFRRAEPRVFALAQQFIVEGLAGHALGCNHTRRCAPAIIDGLNTVFGQAAARREFEGFVPHSTEVAPRAGAALWRLADPVDGGLCEVEPPPAGRRDWLTVPCAEEREPRPADEARRVARAITRLIREQAHAPQDVIVLARRRKMLSLVADELRALHVPCAAAETLHLGELVEVGDLVAVLDALASPGHALSLAQALKSPLFGASDAELLALADRAGDAGGAMPWWTALMQWVDAPPALRRAAALLRSWAEHARTLPPHDLLDRIVHEGDVLARLASVVPPERRVMALAAVQALVEQSLSLDGGRHLSVYRFVRALRQRALGVAAPARTDAVRLMTIHGAKGLEARAVFVVDAAAHPARESVPAVMVDWPVASPEPRGVAFVVNARMPPHSLVDWQAQEQQASAREELNALYVAMTRAEETLVFSRTVPRTASPVPSWWSRVQSSSVEAPWPLRQPPDDAPQALQACVAAIPPRTLAAVPTVPGPGADKDHEVRRLGRAVHRALQWTASAVDLPAALARCAIAAAREAGLPVSAARRVVDIVTTMRRSAALSCYFDPTQLLWAGDEVDIVRDGELLRIDRLVKLGPAEAPVWWVLDYKLESQAADDPRYRQQLSRYRDAVADQVGDAPVRAAIASADGQLHILI